MVVVVIFLDQLRFSSSKQGERTVFYFPQRSASLLKQIRLMLIQKQCSIINYNT